VFLFFLYKNYLYYLSGKLKIRKGKTVKLPSMYLHSGYLHGFVELSNSWNCTFPLLPIIYNDIPSKATAEKRISFHSDNLSIISSTQLHRQ
ncbi:hypothetical protein A5875_003748, partial [Enterococcus sp. 3H8_DIV0648]